MHADEGLGAVAVVMFHSGDPASSHLDMKISSILRLLFDGMQNTRVDVSTRGELRNSLRMAI